VGFRLAGDPEFVYRLFDEMPLMVIAMEVRSTASPL
jgi:hypothetical protein